MHTLRGTLQSKKAVCGTPTNGRRYGVYVLGAEVQDDSVVVRTADTEIPEEDADKSKIDLSDYTGGIHYIKRIIDKLVSEM